MTAAPGRGVIIAAPSSGSGKTTITLGLLRAYHQRAVQVWGAKSGPDYIDVKFHQAASGAVSCYNLDAWAMTPERISSLVRLPGLGIIEGAMGLFDGAPPDGKGSVADLARILNLPVILVVDASKTAQSIAALVAGFARHDPTVRVAGVILNKVGSERHERMLRKALEPLGLPVLGALHRDPTLALPSRHLGLVQASERADLETFLDTAAQAVASALDLQAISDLAGDLPLPNDDDPFAPEPDKVIAIASDKAFDFAYAHQFYDLIMDGWQIKPFSPLRNEPVPKADLIFLPGGYPELYAGQIASNSNFIDSLKKASEHTDIYGECGGYMVLGETLTDADGTQHKMAGLLPLETSFATRKLHLGYRNLEAEHGPHRGKFKGHEFHYATTLKADGPPLFQASDAEGTSLPDMGLRRGRVCGSFAHIIDRVVP
jgi:cobyrinic acid a,c-diamide synthase